MAFLLEILEEVAVVLGAAHMFGEGKTKVENLSRVGDTLGSARFATRLVIHNLHCSHFRAASVHEEETSARKVSPSSPCLHVLLIFFNFFTRSSHAPAFLISLIWLVLLPLVVIQS